MDRREVRGSIFTVLGATGFVGQRLTRKLHDEGALVFVPDRDDPSIFEKPLGHVIYAAGLTADYLSRPFDTVEAHVGFLSRILKQANWSSLVYLSSTRLYDGLGLVDADESMCLRLQPTQPRHLYDLSKALGESLSLTVGKGRARVARLACVYEGFTDADGFLPALLRQALKVPRMEVHTVELETSATYERDYVHVADVVDALIKIAIQGRQDIYNVASGRNVSNSELFAYVENRWGCTVVPKHPPAFSRMPRIQIRRMQEDHDWRPRDVFEVLDTLKSECER